MSTRERPLDRAQRLVHQDRTRIGGEIRAARTATGRSLDAAARSAGMSQATASRIEAGSPVDVPLTRLVALAAAVGLDVRLRAYPGPDPALDVGQLRLIARLRSRLPPKVRIQTEVPLPLAGDQRAWDVVLHGLSGGGPLALDADTRLVDVQAQTRRINLKLRDAQLDAVVWLLGATDHNRAVVRASAETLITTFPVTPRAAHKALSEGRHPGGSAVILL